jgi:hypothetical protein
MRSLRLIDSGRSQVAQSGSACHALLIIVDDLDAVLVVGIRSVKVEDISASSAAIRASLSALSPMLLFEWCMW